MIENRKCNKSYLGFYISAYESASYKAFYFSNGEKAGLVANKNFDITAWNNSVLQYYNYNYPQGKVIKAEPVITTLAAPTILGEKTFTTTTTVTITSTEKLPRFIIRSMGRSLRRHPHSMKARLSWTRRPRSKLLLCTRRLRRQSLLRTSS